MISRWKNKNVWKWFDIIDFCLWFSKFDSNESCSQPIWSIYCRLGSPFCLMLFPSRGPLVLHWRGFLSFFDWRIIIVRFFYFKLRFWKDPVLASFGNAFQDDFYFKTLNECFSVLFTKHAAVMWNWQPIYCVYLPATFYFRLSLWFNQQLTMKSSSKNTHSI